MTLPIKNIVKGDAVTFKCTIDSTDITSWKIRTELWDSTNQIRKATLNSGGADSQILITDAVNGEFEVYISSGDTTVFEDDSNIEIEAETTDSKIYTVYQAEVKFEDERITWSTP